jgi:hypothetical protein
MNAPALLEPLPYHREVRDYLKANEPELWQWFTSARAKESYAEELRLELLKTTYRLTADLHPELYQAAANASVALGVEIGITLYQSQSPSQLPNASIYHLPDEAHIVLSGPISTLLTPPELMSVLAHELAHHRLWRAEDEEFLIADRLLEAVAQDPRADPAQVETARRYRLHTEIYADRGAAHVVQNVPVVVAALVKSMTGLSSVSGESYLAQAEEVLATGKATSQAHSHPELYLRAHALSLWVKAGSAADFKVAALIADDTTLIGMDLLAQQRIHQLTRRFLRELLRPKWFQTEATLAQARLFFPDFAPNQAPDGAIRTELEQAGSLVNEFFVFVLLDFARVDRALEDTPLALTLRWAEELGIAGAYEKLVTKELKVTTRELSKLKPRINDMLALAEKGL